MSLGGLEITELRRLREQFAAQITDQQTLLDSLRAEVISTREEQLLQEIGIYEYGHPLSDAVAYREALKHLQGEIKELARRDSGAIQARQLDRQRVSHPGPQDDPRILDADAAPYNAEGRQPRPKPHAVQARFGARTPR